jgi:hypothetical protein
MSPSTPESRASAVADVLSGADPAHVAKDHGVKTPTVDRWVREHHEAGEALDEWAREQHQEVREQNEAKPRVRGAEEEVAPVATELAELSREETAELLGISVDEDGDPEDDPRDPGVAQGESPEENDPRVANRLAERSPGRCRTADSSVPFLARDANDPHPSSHGSLSATVNDPNY